jgi:hypothetical protein
LCSNTGICPSIEISVKSETGGFDVFDIDDILVHSRSFSEHLVHLDIVIVKLTKARFALNTAKCCFHRNEVRLLLTSKRIPHFKTYNSLERTEIWSWVLTGPEIKNDCAGEDQQQFTGLEVDNSE